MKKAGSRILIITFGIMAAIAILYPWKFVPEYGILQMTESGEKLEKQRKARSPMRNICRWQIVQSKYYLQEIPIRF